jgi:hypothetical protein
MVAKVLWSLSEGAGTARPWDVCIFAYKQSRLYFMRVGTQRRSAMWRLSNAQALIFVAAVAVMVALLLLLLA